MERRSKESREIPLVKTSDTNDEKKDNIKGLDSESTKLRKDFSSWFNKSFEKGTYINWIKSFNMEKHNKIIQSLNNFLKSKKFKILQEHCGYNLSSDVFNKDKFIPRT